MSTGFAVAGLGTIGSGVFELWHKNRPLIHQRSGVGLELVEVADIRQPTHLDLGSVRCSTDAMKTVTAADVDIVVELIGGIGIAGEVVRAALQAGKSVVTANKALIARHGDELHKLAHANGVYLAYEASVCGGIPLLGALSNGLIANRIHSITGTVNGTCNYILSRMLLEDLDFADALKTAQQLGYAEADPSFDIDGIDSAHKTAILAGLAFGTTFNMDACHVCGIRDVAASDLRHCDRLGYRLMHVCHCQANDTGVQLGAYPALVQKSHILAQTFMEMNAAVINADGTGSTFYYGAGAGALPTASAVIADITDIAQRLGGSRYQGAARWYDPARSDAVSTANAPEHSARRWYMRFGIQASARGDLDRQLAQCGIEVDSHLLCSTETGVYIDDISQHKGLCDYIILTNTVEPAALASLGQNKQLSSHLRYPVVDLST
ncbi:MAG: homoserine dehydrogenase [Gammaproteobacteria bacterium]|nr:homoserine dehydrogenase [Gammaproteobacteria bacterium]